jgi:nucleoside-diphosphate-sugar epimerase
MKVLLTGHEGYLGAIISGVLTAAGHDVTGVDAGWYADCTFGPPSAPIEGLRRDVRDLRARDLGGYDAVVHMAALSNDPLGDINPSLTYEINHHASVTLAEAAKQAGVERFVFSSSCSLYGAAKGAELLTEEAPFNPVTPYGESKIRVEQELTLLADDGFSPVYLRNATAYGVSPKLRGDLMVNNLVAYALTTGEVLIKSDGTPWRPLVHAEDIARAVLAVLIAPRERIHDEAFNVGRTEENFQVRDVAEMVARAVPGSRIEYAPGAGADARDYRVDFSKIERQLPEFEPAWTVERGIDDLVDAFRRHGLDAEEFLGPRYQRIATVRGHLDAGRLDQHLRWQVPATVVSSR